MKQQRYGWLAKSVNRYGVAVCAGLLLLMIFLLNYRPGPRHAQRAGFTSLASSNSPVTVRRLSLPWYIRSGQWQADMRSLAAVLRYLADADDLAQTNPIPPRTDDV